MLHSATTTAPLRKRRTRLDDAPFIVALDFAEYRDAPTIARHMLTKGTPATLTTIKKRMAEFVRFTDAVEARGKAWRLVVANDDTPPSSPANDNAILPIGLHHGCGLELMRSLPNAAVDLVLADLPYGTTGIDIDPTIDVAEWMAEMHRILTLRGTIVAFAAQPFTTDLMLASRAYDRGPERFAKEALIWEKTQPTGFPHARARHLKSHEEILVFSKGAAIAKRSQRQMIYNPQGAVEVIKSQRAARKMGYLKNAIRGHANPGADQVSLTNCPRSVLRFAKDSKVHPFAKPVALLEYLIRTYTNDDAVILDPTMGSGSAGVAALATRRRFIGAERERKFYDVAVSRIGDNYRCPETRIASTADRKLAANDDEPSIDLRRGDCMKVMRTMKDKSVDLSFFSPPYNLSEGTTWGMSRGVGTRWQNAKLRNGYASHNDNMPYPDYIAWQKDVLRKVWRLTSDDGAIFYQHKPRVVDGRLRMPTDLIPDELRGNIRQIIIWNRNNGFNFSASFFLPTHEWIVVIAKPAFRLKSRGASGVKDVWTVPPERDNEHPAPFPVALPRMAIDATKCRTIFDPFMGSGSTGVAAQEAGRDFIGIELDSGYFEAASMRIKGHCRHPTSNKHSFTELKGLA